MQIYRGGLLKLQYNQISINGSVTEPVHFLWDVLCCCLCFASRTALASVRAGTAQFSHCSPFLLICKHQDSDTKQGETNHTHTHSSFLVHELITHFSTGINTQILLLSLRRALDRIAVFLKAKKQMENQDFQG